MARKITREQFLRSYWQKKPVIFRAGTNPESLLSPDELAGLSMSEESKARLIIRDQVTEHWTVRHGPFKARELKSLRCLSTMPIGRWSP